MAEPAPHFRLPLKPPQGESGAQTTAGLRRGCLLCVLPRSQGPTPLTINPTHTRAHTVLAPTLPAGAFRMELRFTYKQSCGRTLGSGDAGDRASWTLNARLPVCSALSFPDSSPRCSHHWPRSGPLEHWAEHPSWTWCGLLPPAPWPHSAPPSPHHLPRQLLHSAPLMLSHWSLGSDGPPANTLPRCSRNPLLTTRLCGHSELPSEPSSQGCRVPTLQ